MSAAVGPGDFVECIGLGEPGGLAAVRLEGELVVGRIYQIRDLAPGFDVRSRTLVCGYLLVGVRGFSTYGLAGLCGLESPWDPALFRPVYRRNSDLIESLKAPLPERVEADLATQDLEPAMSAERRAGPHDTRASG